MKRLIVIIAVVIVVAAGFIWRASTGGPSNGSGAYEFVEVTRGDLENVVSATGTLKAVGTVEVGAQVSGRIAELLVDYNDSVREGQILAVLDTTMLAASVRDAEATLMKAEAQHEQAVSDHRRVEELFAQSLVSQGDFDDSATGVKVAKATVLSARAALDRAHAQRIRTISIEKRGAEIVIRCSYHGDMSVERYGLAAKGSMFEEVFGMKIVLLSGTA